MVRFTDCSSQLDLNAWEFEQTDFLVHNEITADEMIGFVEQINERIVEFRLQQVKQTKLILGYVMLGIVFMAALITMLAMWVTPWLSVLVVCAYFLGLYFLQKRTAKITTEMDKAVLFNLAFSLYNMNKSFLESKYKLRCKIGHLGRWIEFHSLRRRVQTEEEKLSSEKEDLLDSQKQPQEKQWRIAPEQSGDSRLIQIG